MKGKISRKPLKINSWNCSFFMIEKENDRDPPVLYPESWVSRRNNHSPWYGVTKMHLAGWFQCELRPPLYKKKILKKNLFFLARNGDFE